MFHRCFPLVSCLMHPSGIHHVRGPKDRKAPVKSVLSDPKTTRVRSSGATLQRQESDSPVAFRLKHVSSGWVPNGE